MADLTPTERACFEAGIKFGSLYHQFAGTPVSPTNAESLAVAMAESIENQPYCERVEVEISTDALEGKLDATHDYTELTGTLFDCEIEVVVDGARARATLVDVDGYPEMQIADLESPS